MSYSAGPERLDRKSPTPSRWALAHAVRWASSAASAHARLAISLKRCYTSDMDKQGMDKQGMDKQGMDKQDKETRLTIRIPAAIAQLLRRLATQHDRSLNGEIV